LIDAIDAIEDNGLRFKFGKEIIEAGFVPADESLQPDIVHCNDLITLTNPTNKRSFPILSIILIDK
jgi:glycogen synthase